MTRLLLCVAALVTALSACAPAAPRPRTTAPEGPGAPRATVSPIRTSPPSVTFSERRRSPRLGPYAVRRVLTGRQLDVDVDGQVRRVVALGIAVPRPGTCRARTAVRGARGLLAGRTVYLSTDPAVRTRREWYVWTAAGLYQARLLRAGYAAARARPGAAVRRGAAAGRARRPDGPDRAVVGGHVRAAAPSAPASPSASPAAHGGAAAAPRRSAGLVPGRLVRAEPEGRLRGPRRGPPDVRAAAPVTRLARCGHLRRLPGRVCLHGAHD